MGFECWSHGGSGLPTGCGAALSNRRSWANCWRQSLQELAGFVDNLNDDDSFSINVQRRAAAEVSPGKPRLLCPHSSDQARSGKGGCGEIHCCISNGCDGGFIGRCPERSVHCRSPHQLLRLSIQVMWGVVSPRQIRSGVMKSRPAFCDDPAMPEYRRPFAPGGTFFSFIRRMRNRGRHTRSAAPAGEVRKIFPRSPLRFTALGRQQLGFRKTAVGKVPGWR